MADESVKDLVVRLSFEHGDTKSQIQSIKNEMKLLDSGFQAAAASAGGFSGGMNEAAAKAQLLKQQIALQEQAVQKYGQAIEQAQQKLQAAQERQKQYGELLEAAKGRHAELEAEIKNVQAAMEASAAATGEGTEEYQQLEQRLKELQAEYEQNETAIKGWEDGIKRTESTIVRTDQSLQKLTTAQNQSKAAIGRMKSELDSLNGSVDTHRQRLEKAAASLKNFSEHAEKAGDRMERAGRTMSRATAAIVGAGTAAVATAVQWESSCADVEKTVSGTAEQLKTIEDGLMEMSQQKPIDATVLAEIAANAGQLGIATDNVLAFTGVMGDLANTTNLTAEEGASAFAKFANITGMSQTNFDRLGSTVVTLGNNMATTEADIVAMGTNLASAGSQIGMSEAEIMGMAAALSSLGLEAQAGGTAFSKLFVNMKVAAETGGEDLKKYASVAGMTAAEFQKAFGQDAAGTVTKFIQGLSSGSKSAIVMLDEMGIKETRFRDALLRSSNATELFTNAMEMANTSWQENTALGNEAAVRYNTTAAQMQMLGNRAKAVAVQFGNDLMPVLKDLLGWVEKVVAKFGSLDEGQRKQILMWGAFVAALGPVTSALGHVTSGVGTVAGALSKLGTAAANSSGALSGIASVAGKGGLYGIIAALVAALAIGGKYFMEWASGAKAAREAISSLNETARSWKETVAETFYDTGTADPLSLFGLSKSDFTGAVEQSGDWFARLIATWTDGKAETTEIVKSFAEEFSKGSEGVREAIAGQKDLLEGYEALTPEQQAAMQADLEQLDAWDKEVEALLKKRKNGYLTDEEQARLQEILTARAQLEVKYSLDAGDGYDQIITGMNAAIERAKNGGSMDSTFLGDTMNALAEGRKAYMEALNGSYDAEYAQIQLIEDETARMAALDALNERYREKRAQGEEEYAAAVREAGKTVWENTDMSDQIATIDELAALIGSFEDIDLDGFMDPTQLQEIAKYAEQLSEADLASTLTMIEQLKAAGVSDEELAEMGINYQDILEKLTAIRDVANSTEGLEGLGAMIGEALPEEIQRLMIGLDMTQAEADWAGFAEGKTLTPTVDLTNTGPIDLTGSIKQLEMAPGVTFTADGDGNITSVTTADGITFTADGDGHITSITKADGLTFNLDGDGQVTSVTTVDGLTFSLDGDGSVTSVTTAEGLAFSVDGDGNVTGITTAEGLSFEVDGDGNVTSIVTKEGLTFSADGEGHVTSLTLPTGEVIDLKGNIKEVAKMPGVTVEVDGKGRITSATTAEGVKFTADGDGNITGVTTAEGTTFSVDGDGNITGVTTAEGVTFTMDGDGNITGVTTAEGVTFTMDGDGNITGVTMADGTTFTLDGNGNITSVTTADGITFAGVEGSGIISKLSLGPDVSMPTLSAAAKVRLNPLDRRAISAWELANKDKEVNGPPARMGVKLGADWTTDLQSAYEAGILEVWGADGAKLDVTPEILSQITANDIAILEADGTLHVIITPELGSTEAIEQTTAALEDKGPLQGTAFEFMASSTMEDVQNINDAADAYHELAASVEEVKAAGGGDPFKTAMDEEELRARATAMREMFDGMDTDVDVEALAADAAQLMAALSSGELDENTAAEYAAQLQQIASLVSNADEFIGSGNAISAGIAEGMKAYGWDSDASNVADLLQAAVDAAFGIASPAETMKPTGQNVAAGIAEGMTEFDFSSAAGSVASGIISPFSGLGGEGRTIGANFGQGLYNGLSGKMSDTLKLAKSYAEKITAAFRNAWDEHSPSKVAQSLTEMFGAGLGEGMKHWPKVSERMLKEDIGSLYSGARQARANVNNNTNNYSNAVNLNVDRMEVRDRTDAEGLAHEIAGITRRSQRSRGH